MLGIFVVVPTRVGLHERNEGRSLRRSEGTSRLRICLSLSNKRFQRGPGLLGNGLAEIGYPRIKPCFALAASAYQGGERRGGHLWWL